MAPCLRLQCFDHWATITRFALFWPVQLVCNVLTNQRWPLACNVLTKKHDSRRLCFDHFSDSRNAFHKLAIFWPPTINWLAMFWPFQPVCNVLTNQRNQRWPLACNVLTKKPDSNSIGPQRFDQQSAMFWPTDATSAGPLLATFWPKTRFGVALFWPLQRNSLSLPLICNVLTHRK